MATNDGVSQPGAEWDEAQCKAALARLEQLQEDLANLRLNLPRVVEPFTSHSTSSPAMFQAFKKSVVASQNDIRSIRNHWHSQDVQSIFEHTTQSLNKNSDLTASANVPRYGWVKAQTKEKEAARRKNDGVQKLEDTVVNLTNEDVTRDILEFQKTHTNIKALTKDDNQNLLFQFVAGSVKLRIRVVIEREANGRHKLNAECLGTVEPFLAITRCISSRPKVKDFKYLLDMIAAYKNIKGTSCAKCSRLIDNAALIPTARRSKQIIGANGTPEIVWEAFHEGCLD
ncbi:hypothetical protein K505DRAFT_366434 [Melanomma pulvis-pyrius CBS 109.77]|uniref:Uncharacterized protein n=1 Tax=Melanomma pulvis-pyrius CBS 109.77 TaxID=1314802 RepID=A0A6A6WWM3_9PLEO|nr:hypothetical protein K505DRAFT_366434 [Melanomma pulvis-pyrius CBS 109.77]